LRKARKVFNLATADSYGAALLEALAIPSGNAIAKAQAYTLSEAIPLGLYAALLKGWYLVAFVIKVDPIKVSVYPTSKKFSLVPVEKAECWN
jgi:hypothetical protein